VRLGVCYYPEQWPRDRWAVDAQMMADAGLELVRIGEFAWSAYEPARGRWEWEWLDEVIAVLGAAGLQVVLGTPTATPPVWLMAEHPEILSVGADGHRRAYGSRRHTCPTSAAYREEAQRVVGALVQRYGHNPHVAAWQVDNEPGNHDSARCWCDECHAVFSAWLASRYGDIATLNAAWGATFWSMDYPSFDAVRLPVPTMTGHNPSLLLAHRRFSSAQVVAGLAEQHAIIAGGSPGRDVTTNLYLGDLDVDARDVARPTGLASFDNYPHGTSGPDEVAYVLDLARGLAGTRRYWVMEQQPGPVNWTGHNPMVPPGQVRDWILQAAAHGAEALLLFRWRAARGGQEQYHAGLLRQDGTPDRGLAEVTEAHEQLTRTPPKRSRAQVALLHAYDDAWAIEIDPHGPGITHRGLQLPAYVAARNLGHAVDIVAPSDDLSAYRVVLAPALHLHTTRRVAALQAAADAGATVVLGPRSLVADRDDVWLDAALPGGLTSAIGARVVEWGNPITWPGLDQPLTVDGLPCGPWFEVYDTSEHDGTETLLRYEGGHLGGAAAAVRKGRFVAAGFAAVAPWERLLRKILGPTA
jgi:beta-galactosidase